MSTTPTTERRRYTSPKRAEQAAATRAAVLSAAVTCFAEHGWHGTSMRTIARDAGVSVETLYSTFGSKADLLHAALDVAVVGDTEPIALEDRPEFADLGRGGPEVRARAAARLAREVNERTNGIARALREGAASEEPLAARLTDAERNRRADVAAAAALVAGRAVDARERDGLWAVASDEVYSLLVERAGWSAEEYEEWLADAIRRLLVPGGSTR